MDYVILAAIIFTWLTLGLVYNEVVRTRINIKTILTKECELMATVQEFDEAIGRIEGKINEGNTSLGKIEADIQTLKDQLATGGLTGEQEDAARARIATLEQTVSDQADRLRAIDDATPDAKPDATPPDEPVNP